MTTTPDYELLKDAHAIIDGIPDAAVAFGPPCKTRGPRLEDGTVCSPEGWLALHPTFTALGLTISPDGSSLHVSGNTMSAVAAMAQIFRVPEEEAALLFGERSLFLSEESTSDVSDRQLWLTRVRHHIHSRAMSQTVAAITMAPAVTMARLGDVIEGEPR